MTCYHTALMISCLYDVACRLLFYCFIRNEPELPYQMQVSKYPQNLPFVWPHAYHLLHLCDLLPFHIFLFPCFLYFSFKGDWWGGGGEEEGRVITDTFYGPSEGVFNTTFYCYETQNSG